LVLNNTNALNGAATFSATSTTFDCSQFVTTGTYVAYLFAHNAGGFGLSGEDNVISCGSYTGTGAAGNAINLGYEPQWVMIKESSLSGNGWCIFDSMRGAPDGSAPDSRLQAESSAAEVSTVAEIAFTSTGFKLEAAGGRLNTSGATYIYIAIRRGPMKVPESGTSVFDTALYTGNATARTITLSSTMPYTDMGIWRARTGGTNNFNQGWWTVDRLRGMVSTPSTAGVNSRGLLTAFTDAESAGAPYSVINNTADLTSGTSLNVNTAPFLTYSFRRAPSVFDVVCYTGTGGVNRQVTHNLGVQPELYIVKRRNGAKGWFVGSTLLSGPSYYMYLDLNVAQSNGAGASDVWGTSFPTSSYFLVSDTNAYNNTNTSGDTYVAYLFASCPGVSKVGSYTGTGTTQAINCGFTAGARFVLIKSTSTTGNWLVWDSARGIVAGNDPYLTLNTTAAEVTNTDWVDTAATGFELSNAGSNLANSNGATYIFLAIA
jgi:hypothetical protein